MKKMNLVIVCAMAISLAACGSDNANPNTSDNNGTTGGSNNGTVNNMEADAGEMEPDSGEVDSDSGAIPMCGTEPALLVNGGPYIEPTFSIAANSRGALMTWKLGSFDDSGFVQGDLGVAYAEVRDPVQVFPPIFDASGDPTAESSPATTATLANDEGFVVAWNYNATDAIEDYEVRALVLPDEAPVRPEPTTITTEPSIILGTGLQNGESPSLITWGDPGDAMNANFVYFQFPGLEGSPGTFRQDVIKNGTLRLVTLGDQSTAALYEKEGEPNLFWELLDASLTITGNGKSVSEIGADSIALQRGDRIAIFSENNIVVNDDLVATKIRVLILEGSTGDIVADVVLAEEPVDGFTGVQSPSFIEKDGILSVLWTLQVTNSDGTSTADLFMADLNLTDGSIVREPAVVLSLEPFADSYPAGYQFAPNAVAVARSGDALAILYSVGYFEFDDDTQNSATYAGLDYYFQWYCLN